MSRLVTGIGGVEDLNERTFAHRAAQEGGSGSQVVRAKDHVDPVRALHDGAAVLLGHASAHRDLHARVGTP